MGNLKADLNALRNVLYVHYPLIGVLIGTFLVSASFGPYSNWDAQLEFEAASNVVTKGLPYISTGYMINQPPFGFYIAASIFRIVGLSYAKGVNIITLFGLGSVFLVYEIGSTLYGKKTGLLAAAFFGLTPWQVFMSHAFLVDVQCLFLSLLYLLVGIWAIRKNSMKLVLLSGTIFGFALLTKLFSVFMLIPLVLILYFERSRGFKLTPKKTALFLLPTLILQSVWYGGFANQNFFGVYFNSDFTHPVKIIAPSILFLPRLLTESMGWFLIIGAIFSLLLSISQRKLFPNALRSDFICAATIFGVLGLNFLLVVGFNVNAAYVSAFKYTYQALPIFCCLAASLAIKSYSLFKFHFQKGKNHILASLATTIGLAVISASIVENMIFLYTHAGTELIFFRVDMATGYPFQLFSPILETSCAQAIQLTAFFFIAFSLLLSLIINRRFKNGIKRRFSEFYSSHKS